MKISLLHRKEAIIITAIEIIDELGLQGLTSREIAKRQSISEGTLFKHFKNKSEIILAVLDHFSQYDLDIMKTVTERGMKPIDGIRYFIDTYSVYYENYPAIASILHTYNELMSTPDFYEKVRSIINNRMECIIGLIEEGKRMGEIKDSVDTENLMFIIFGIERSICLKWKMEGYKFSLRERIMSALNMTLDVFEVKQKFKK